MANYYTNFSFIMNISESEKHWIERFLILSEKLVKEENYEPINVEFRDLRPADVVYEAWFYSYGDEYSSVNALSEFMKRFLVKFERDDVIVIEWANDCSKPRVDGFGGGAVVISRLGIDFINTTGWAQQMSKLVGRRLTVERAAA